jgi:hypothetical protein
MLGPLFAVFAQRLGGNIDRAHLSSSLVAHALDSPERERFARLYARWGGRRDNGAVASADLIGGTS